MKRILIFSLISLIFATSCTVSRQQVGNYEEKEGEIIVYKKGKDFYLFWDQLPVNRIEKNLKIDDYEIIIKRRFFDSVIYYGTLVHQIINNTPYFYANFSLYCVTILNHS